MPYIGGTKDGFLQAGIKGEYLAVPTGTVARRIAKEAEETKRAHGETCIVFRLKYVDFYKELQKLNAQVIAEYDAA